MEKQSCRTVAFNGRVLSWCSVFDIIYRWSCSPYYVRGADANIGWMLRGVKRVIANQVRILGTEGIMDDEHDQFSLEIHHRSGPFRRYLQGIGVSKENCKLRHMSKQCIRLLKNDIWEHTSNSSSSSTKKL